jgi:hypothetical protein
MGEYAYWHDDYVKIGTCDNMYYLRADDATEVRKCENSLDPVLRAADGALKFRFPFPDEDGIPPGHYKDAFTSFGVRNVNPPSPMDHGRVSFKSTQGLTATMPCLFSRDWKKIPEDLVTLRGAGFGLAGRQIEIIQQRVHDGKLIPICQCAHCHAKFRYDDLADCLPIIESLREEAETASVDRKRLLKQTALRIIGGYKQPPEWVKATAQA